MWRGKKIWRDNVNVNVRWKLIWCKNENMIWKYKFDVKMKMWNESENALVMIEDKKKVKRKWYIIKK